MDLRPKIARSIVNAILREQGIKPSKGKRERLVEIAFSKMQSKSIRLHGEWGTKDPRIVQRFLRKYPALQNMVDECKKHALGICPEVTFKMELWDDPESCHICQEGQKLRLTVEVPVEVYPRFQREYPPDSLYEYPSDMESLFTTWAGILGSEK